MELPDALQRVLGDPLERWHASESGWQDDNGYNNRWPAVSLARPSHESLVGRAWARSARFQCSVAASSRSFELESGYYLVNWILKLFIRLASPLGERFGKHLLRSARLLVSLSLSLTLARETQAVGVPRRQSCADPR